METVYSEAVPSKAFAVLVNPLNTDPATDKTGDPVVVGDVVIISDEVDKTVDAVMVVDVIIVSDEVDVAVLVAKTVGAKLVGVTILVEAVDATCVTTVAFAEIGAVAATANRNAEASERADDAAGGMLEAPAFWGTCIGRMVGLPAIVVEMNGSGPAVQDSGKMSTVLLTVVTSSHPVNGSSSFSPIRIEGRVTDHGQPGHQICEQDVLRGLHGLCCSSDEVRNPWES